jgi:hypothetical protein
MGVQIGSEISQQQQELLQKAGEALRCTISGIIDSSIFNKWESVPLASRNPSIGSASTVAFGLALGSSLQGSFDYSLEPLRDLISGSFVSAQSFVVPRDGRSIPGFKELANDGIILMRGEIARSVLRPRALDFIGSSFGDSVTSDRIEGTLSALSIRQAAIYRPQINSLSDYAESVQSQWRYQLEKLKGLLTL